MKTLASILLIVGYVGLYQIYVGKTHLIPIILMVFGLAFIIGLQVGMPKTKRK
ncbi:MAG: hypothetical protein WCJ95_09610 [Mariniphaga sp.]